MKNTNQILILLFSLIFAGCSGVVTEEPVGNVINIKEEALKERSDFEVEDLEGTWNGGDDILYSKLQDDGITLKVARLHWDEKKQDFSLQSEDVVLSELGENTYVNQKRKNGDGYYIAALGSSYVEADAIVDIVVFYPDDEKFNKAIREKKLVGTTGVPEQKDGDIYLKSTKEEIDVFIRDNYSTLFKFETPKVYRKIPWVKL